MFDTFYKTRLIGLFIFHFCYGVFDIKTLKTERLILRPFKESDLDDFFEYASMPNVGLNAGWKPHESKEESLSILKEFISLDDIWAMEIKESRKVVGGIGLHEDNHRLRVKSRSLGYVLSEDYWGKGLMTEAAKAAIQFAFTGLELDILGVAHRPDNERSKNVILKCGFLREGHVRHAVTTFNGQVEDRIIYSMTKEEYFQNFN